MGVENNNAILATTWNQDEVRRVIEWLQGLDDNLRRYFLIGPPLMNNRTTIVMIPDGSKEGWEDSAVGDVLRGKFIDVLHEGQLDPDDPSDSYWDYVEVGYGEFGQHILRGNNKNVYGACIPIQPCPFCGLRGILQEVHSGDCKISIWYSIGCDDPDCFAALDTGWGYTSKDEALQYWNKRN